MPQRITRIFLAEDHLLVRQGMRSLLEMEDDIIVVGEAGNGADAIEKVQNGLRPHVILMDVNMPIMTGIEATRRIRSLMPDVMIIGLTAADDGPTISEMLHAGANGYVLKSTAADELVRTIRSTRANRSWSSPTPHSQAREAKRKGMYAIQSMSQRADIHQWLTRREVQVMKNLLQGWSNKEIAEHLVISERTVQTHLTNIFSKMDVKSRTEAVLMAIRDGWAGHYSV